MSFADRAHIGTSGWAYPEWKPAFYPAELPRRRFLEYYATTLTACEINATFYRLQGAETVRRWADATPPDFRFAAKAHRRLTHGSAPAEDHGWFAFLDEFMRSLEPLGDRLGALLVQLPHTRRRDDEVLDRVVDAVVGETPVALELRHASWSDPAVAERVAARGATVCLTDTTGAVPARLPPGPIAYVRLRAEHYDEEQCDGWRALIAREAEHRPVMVFARHKDLPADDPGCGVGLARRLLRPPASGQSSRSRRSRPHGLHRGGGESGEGPRPA